MPRRINTHKHCHTCSQVRFGSTAHSRYLGRILRGKRSSAGLLGRELGFKTGWDQSKISVVEHGLVPATDAEVATVLTACGVKGDELQRLVTQWRGSHDETWFQDNSAYGGDVVHATLRAELEWATTWSFFSPTVIPEHFSRHRCYVNESVLHGLPRDQLVDLLQYCGAIGIVPTMPQAETFYLLENDEPAVCVLTGVGVLYLESRHHIAHYRGLLDALADVALSGADAHELIASLADD